MKKFLQPKAAAVLAEAERSGSSDPVQAAAMRLKQLYMNASEFDRSRQGPSLLTFRPAAADGGYEVTVETPKDPKARALEAHRSGARVYVLDGSASSIQEVQTPESMCRLCGRRLVQDAYTSLHAWSGCEHAQCAGKVHLKCADEWSELGSPFCGAIARDDCALHAARMGHLGVLVHVGGGGGGSLPPEVAEVACAHGQDHVAAQLVNMGAPLDARACLRAALRGGGPEHARVVRTLRWHHKIPVDVAVELAREVRASDVREHARIMEVLDAIVGEYALVGERAVVRGIVSQRDLNGMKGEVLALVPDTGRFEMRLDTGRCVRLKRENFEIATPAPESLADAGIRLVDASVAAVSDRGMLTGGTFTRADGYVYGTTLASILEQVSRQTDARRELDEGMYASALLEMCPDRGPRRGQLARVPPDTMQILGPYGDEHGFEEQYARYRVQYPTMREARHACHDVVHRLRTPFGAFDVVVTYRILFVPEHRDMAPDLRAMIVPAALSGIWFEGAGIHMVAAQFRTVEAARKEEARHERVRRFLQHEEEASAAARAHEAARRARAAESRALERRVRENKEEADEGAERQAPHGVGPPDEPPPPSAPPSPPESDDEDAGGASASPSVEQVDAARAALRAEGFAVTDSATDKSTHRAYVAMVDAQPAPRTAIYLVDEASARARLPSSSYREGIAGLFFVSCASDRTPDVCAHALVSPETMATRGAVRELCASMMRREHTLPRFDERKIELARSALGAEGFVVVDSDADPKTMRAFSMQTSKMPELRTAIYIVDEASARKILPDSVASYDFFAFEVVGNFFVSCRASSAAGGDTAVLHTVVPPDAVTTREGVRAMHARVQRRERTQPSLPAVCQTERHTARDDASDPIGKRAPTSKPTTRGVTEEARRGEENKKRRSGDAVESAHAAALSRITSALGFLTRPDESSGTSLLDSLGTFGETVVSTHRVSFESRDVLAAALGLWLDTGGFGAKEISLARSGAFPVVWRTHPQAREDQRRTRFAADVFGGGTTAATTTTTTAYPFPPAWLPDDAVPAEAVRALVLSVHRDELSAYLAAILVHELHIPGIVATGVATYDAEVQMNPLCVDATCASGRMCDGAWQPRCMMHGPDTAPPGLVPHTVTWIEVAEMGDAPAVYFFLDVTPERRDPFAYARTKCTIERLDSVTFAARCTTTTDVDSRTLGDAVSRVLEIAWREDDVGAMLARVADVTHACDSKFGTDMTQLLYDALVRETGTKRMPWLGDAFSRHLGSAAASADDASATYAAAPVEVRSSKVLTGYGLFATRSFSPGDVVFEEDVVLVHETIAMSGRARGRAHSEMLGVSQAWALTVLLLESDLAPWAHELQSNEAFARAQLADPKDRALCESLQKKFPSRDVVGTFARVITNFFAQGGLTWLGPLSSRLNHADAPNVGMTSRVVRIGKHGGRVTYVAARPICAGAELCITYPPEVVAYFDLFAPPLVELTDLVAFLTDAPKSKRGGKSLLGTLPARQSSVVAAYELKPDLPFYLERTPWPMSECEDEFHTALTLVPRPIAFVVTVVRHATTTLVHDVHTFPESELRRVKESYGFCTPVAREVVDAFVQSVDRGEVNSHYLLLLLDSLGASRVALRSDNTGKYGRIARMGVGYVPMRVQTNPLDVPWKWSADAPPRHITDITERAAMLCAFPDGYDDEEDDEDDDEDDDSGCEIKQVLVWLDVVLQDGAHTTFHVDLSHAQIDPFGGKRATVREVSDDEAKACKRDVYDADASLRNLVGQCGGYEKHLVDVPETEEVVGSLMSPPDLVTVPEAEDVVRGVFDRFAAMTTTCDREFGVDTTARMRDAVAASPWKRFTKSFEKSARPRLSVTHLSGDAAARTVARGVERWRRCRISKAMAMLRREGFVTFEDSDAHTSICDFGERVAVYCASAAAYRRLFGGAATSPRRVHGVVLRVSRPTVCIVVALRDLGSREHVRSMLNTLRRKAEAQLAHDAATYVAACWRGRVGRVRTAQLAERRKRSQKNRKKKERRQRQEKNQREERLKAGASTSERDDVGGVGNGGGADAVTTSERVAETNGELDGGGSADAADDSEYQQTPEVVPLAAAVVPGARAPPESTIGGETTCIVCFVEAKDHLAVPCGHQCVCADCSKKVNVCPYCRTDVALWQRVHVV